MRIAVLGVGHIGSTVGRLWHAAGHEVTFAGRDEGEPRELATELGDRAHTASVADAVAGADVALVAVPGTAVTDVLTAAGRLDGNSTLEPDDAKALANRVRAGHTEAADPLTAPFEKLRDHAPDDPAFFFEHLSRAVFQAGMSWRVVSAKWDGIRDAFGGFDPDKVAAMQPDDIARIEADTRVIRNRAKIEATVQNAQELLVILGTYGSIRGYLTVFPDARSAAGDLHRRFRFLGDAGVWRLLTSAARDL